MDLTFLERAVNVIQGDEKGVVRKSEVEAESVRWRVHAPVDQVFEEGALSRENNFVSVNSLLLDDEEDVRQKTRVSENFQLIDKRLRLG